MKKIYRFILLFVLLVAMFPVNHADAAAPARKSCRSVDVHYMDSVRIPQVNIPLDNLTVEMWVRLDQGYMYDMARYLFAQGADYGSLNMLAHSLDDGFTLNVYFWDTTGHRQFYSGMYKLGYNGWHHVALTKGNDVMNLFVNGELVASANYYGSVPLHSDEILSVGALVSNQYTFEPLLGQIDEFRLSNTVRYTGSFTPSFREFAPDLSTLVLLHFNKDAKDSSGYGNNGMLVENAHIVKDSIVCK